MIKKLFPSTILFYVVLMLAIEWIVSIDLVSSALIPKPSTLILLFVQKNELFREAFIETASLSSLAFISASGLAVGLSLLIHQWSFLQKKIIPLTLFLQTVPIIAIAPLLVIYLGFGIPTILSAAMIVCFFPVFAATSVGLHQAQKTQLELFDFLKASEFQKLIHLKLPSAMPTLFAGLKTSAGLSVVGVVSGEFVAGGGLGALIDSARLQQRVDLVFAALILLSIIGLSLSQITDIIFKLLFRRYLVSI